MKKKNYIRKVLNLAIQTDLDPTNTPGSVTVLATQRSANVSDLNIHFSVTEPQRGSLGPLLLFIGGIF